MYICNECQSEYDGNFHNHKLCPSCVGRKGGRKKSLLIKEKIGKLQKRPNGDTTGYFYYTRSMLTPEEQALLPDDGRIILIHRLILAKKLGRPLQKGEVVMHIDGDKWNNKPENLMVGDSKTNTRQHWEARMEAERWKNISVLLLGLIGD